MSSQERDWHTYFNRVDETRQRRVGGRVLRIETVPKLRSRRASRSRTPRLDAMRHSLAIYSYMLEREERAEQEP